MFDVSDVENMISYVVKHPKDMKSIKEIHDSVVYTKHKREKMLLCMKRAIENESFEVYYQPIYSTKTGRFESCEALVRLFDEELGMLDPEEMVILAEKNGLIDKIGDIIFRKVCEFMRDNDYASLGLKYIEVNLSTVQCMKLALPDSIRSIMDHYQLPSSAINLEITETAELEDEGTLLKNVRTLDKMGINFSIDDYGSGFASAGYLIKFPVTLVKIDKSILWNAMEDKDAMVVLKHTISMVQELNKHIVVEGVETNEMKRILMENGVDYLQGYLFSKPIPAEKFVEFLKRNNSRFFDEEDEEEMYYYAMNANTQRLSGMNKKKEPEPKKKKVLRSDLPDPEDLT
jgi:EAL domain-containing protein (putative c-di-GMP-specific phosphodiesterase class I)